MREFKPCSRCTKKGGPKPGYVYIEVDGYKVAKECLCHSVWAKEVKAEKECIKNHVNGDISLDDYKGAESKESVEALKYLVENFDQFKTKTNIYIYGTNGTQKTTMAKAAARELIFKDFKVKYILMNTLVDCLDNNIEQDEAKERTVQECKDADLLIIDEAFDVTKVLVYKSGYQIPFIDTFLRERYDVFNKSTLFISNVVPSNIDTDKFGASLKNFVDRTTKHSYLEFEDVYVKQSAPDSTLFKVRGH